MELPKGNSDVSQGNAEIQEESFIGAPTRFEVELDFVQALANPYYVNYLAQNGYLEDTRFLNYLEYLEYWRKPEYVKFVVYPNCLHMLSLLRQPRFRQEVKHSDMAQLLINDMLAKWLRIGRYKLFSDGDEPTGAEVTSTEFKDEIKQELATDQRNSTEVHQYTSSERSRPSTANGTTEPLVKLEQPETDIQTASNGANP
ncbi:SOH1-domain-containing protein [Lipomyces oligophaga]|uniref:SOH1-domain-containing protein n=1 Tax=Lipomyces oligophaga TaxID=45792 RepID=UPI0034CD69C7